MPDFTFGYGFIIRASLIITIFMVVMASAWAVSKKWGFLRLDQPSSAADLRTWPLSFVLAVAGIYGAVFAVIQATFGENAVSSTVAAGVGWLISIAIISFIIRRRET